MNPPVDYVPNFLPALGIDPKGALAVLINDLYWVKKGDRPRHEYYVNRLGHPYQYGAPPGNIEYLAQPTHALIDIIWGLAEDACKTKFEVCFLNRYDDARMHLGWHSDNSPEMDDARPIAVVSLGAERPLQFRPIQERTFAVNGNALEAGIVPAVNHAQLLASGSLLVMKPGMQDTWQHRIPKMGRECMARVSLTFRGYAS